MQKLKLDLEVLKVDSFDAGSAETARGTVAANAATGTTTLIGTTSTIIVTMPRTVE